MTRLMMAPAALARNPQAAETISRVRFRTDVLILAVARGFVLTLA